MLSSLVPQHCGDVLGGKAKTRPVSSMRIAGKDIEIDGHGNRKQSSGVNVQEVRPHEYTCRLRWKAHSGQEWLQKSAGVDRPFFRWTLHEPEAWEEATTSRWRKLIKYVIVCTYRCLFWFNGCSISPSWIMLLFVFPFQLFVVQWKEGRFGEYADTFDSVLKCARKKCINPGNTVKDSYTCDKMGTFTGLAHVHQVEGTGKNEAAHRRKGIRSIRRILVWRAEQYYRWLLVYFKHSSHNDSSLYTGSRDRLRIPVHTCNRSLLSTYLNCSEMWRLSYVSTFRIFTTTLLCAVCARRMPFCFWPQ